MRVPNIFFGEAGIQSGIRESIAPGFRYWCPDIRNLVKMATAVQESGENLIHFRIYISPPAYRASSD